MSNTKDSPIAVSIISLSLIIRCVVAPVKFQSARGVSHHLPFMGFDAFLFLCYVWALGLLLQLYFKAWGDYLTTWFDRQLVDVLLIPLCPTFRVSGHEVKLKRWLGIVLLARRKLVFLYFTCLLWSNSATTERHISTAEVSKKGGTFWVENRCLVLCGDKKNPWIYGVC